MQKIKTKLNRAKIFFSDHWHLLFRPAAENHIRIHKLPKNSDGTCQTTVTFGSYSELKRYQKKFRRAAVSLSGALAMLIAVFVTKL